MASKKNRNTKSVRQALRARRERRNKGSLLGVDNRARHQTGGIPGVPAWVPKMAPGEEEYYLYADPFNPNAFPPPGIPHEPLTGGGTYYNPDTGELTDPVYTTGPSVATTAAATTAVGGTTTPPAPPTPEAPLFTTYPVQTVSRADTDTTGSDVQTIPARTPVPTPAAVATGTLSAVTGAAATAAAQPTVAAATQAIATAGTVAPVGVATGVAQTGIAEEIRTLTAEA